MMEKTINMWVVKLPLNVSISKASKRYPINLNGYRNWHYHISDAIKKEYKAIVKPQIEVLPVMGKVSITYNIYYSRRGRFDIMNISSISAKFFEDALVEFGKLPDDSYEYIPQVHTYFKGIDNANPRVEAVIEEI